MKLAAEFALRMHEHSSKEGDYRSRARIPVRAGEFLHVVEAAKL